MRGRAPSTRPVSRAARLAAAAYVVAWIGSLVGPPAVMLRWRETRLTHLAAPAAQADWDAFRADMRRQSGASGPVQRKVPRSAEPPELVWLRDYAALAIAAWVGFVGVLGACLGFLLVGSLRAAADSATEDQPRGGRHHEQQNHRDPDHAEKREHRSPPR